MPDVPDVPAEPDGDRDDRLSPQLAELAELLGVATRFTDWQGRTAAVAPSTVEAVLGALGLDVSTPQAVSDALRETRLRPWRRVLPCVVVAREGSTVPVPVCRTLVFSAGSEKVRVASCGIALWVPTFGVPKPCGT